MKIEVKYFASIREALGKSAESVQTAATNIAELRQELSARGPDYAEALASNKAIRAALNQTLCEESARLSEGDETAFFPPVTGG